ncbi:MAG: phosphate ABC transporter permease subunit PstC [Magnetococcus sp. DMHC-1]|nr:phosphate ABC transporter permease subunit PstC [Magnetococcales bacterium]
MSSQTALYPLFLLSLAAFFLGYVKANALVTENSKAVGSRPPYHGWYCLFWTLLPGMILFVLWHVLQGTLLDRLFLASMADQIGNLSPEETQLWMARIRRIAGGGMAMESQADLLTVAAEYHRTAQYSGLLLTILVTALSAWGLHRSWRKISPELPARHFVEKTVLVILGIGSALSFLITLGIVLSLLFEALRFFQKVPFGDFFLGLHWSPQTAIRTDQVGGSGEFGAIPLFAGTFMIMLIALSMAAPVGLAAAVYLAEFARPRVRALAKPALEILAGIPTVVYGFFAALIVAPAIARMGGWLGLNVASESALAAGLVMGIMIIPFVSSLTDDVISAVPQALRDGSLALGATHAETVLRVVLPAALPGIVGALLLAVSRAVGETMIVVMSAGLAANLTGNPLNSMTTVTVQIVTLLVGDQEFDSPKTLAAFALGLTLFFITLTLNVVALAVVRKYHEEEH